MLKQALTGGSSCRLTSTARSSGLGWPFCPHAGVSGIANPSNGPGTKVDPNYSRWTRRVSSGGRLVLGYVHTGWASRPLTEAERDIDKWLELYPEARGFFVDGFQTARRT